MSHVFISYSHKDQDYAVQLAQTLEMEGYSAWIDNRGIDYGAHWPQVIQQALDSCVAFIVVMSPTAFESQWVQNELSRANRKKKPIFPLLLEGDEPWLMVESTQYADVRGGKMPPAKFYERLGEVAPRKQPDPQDSGYIVFDLDSKVPQHVPAPPPPLRQKVRGVIRETGSHKAVDVKQTESGWFTPDSAPKSSAPSPRHAQPQQPYAAYQQPYVQAQGVKGTAKWKIWAGIVIVGFIGLMILIAVISDYLSEENGDDDSQVEVAEDFIRALVRGDYETARDLTSSSCSDLLFTIDDFEFQGVVLGTATNFSCHESDTDTIFCEYLLNGFSSADTIYMDGNEVCSFEIE